MARATVNLETEGPNGPTLDVYDDDDDEVGSDMLSRNVGKELTRHIA
jgi:hypothetical protein